MHQYVAEHLSTAPLATIANDSFATHSLQGGLDELCSAVPANYYYCAVDINGTLTVVKDGYSQDGVSCSVLPVDCCTDDVLIKDDKVLCCSTT